MIDNVVISGNPTVNGQSVSVSEDTTTTIPLTGSDPDGDTFYFSVYVKPSHGRAFTSGTSVIYTPEVNYTGTDSFNVVAIDSNGATSAQATISITVVAANDPPAFTLPAGTSTGPAGATWTPLAGANHDWRSIACSADGMRLAAVDYVGRIYTSSNFGRSWTARETSQEWLAIASSADGMKLAATGYNTQIKTSIDGGVTWTSRISILGRGIASSGNGTKLAAVAGGGRIYTSTDSGANWTARETNREWRSIASSDDGSKLVAVVASGQIYTSTDSGGNWTARQSTRSWLAVASSANGTMLAALASNSSIYTSTDSGVNWVARASGRAWNGIASSADGMKLAATVSAGRIYTSIDAGLTWTPTDSNRNWYSIVSSADGSKLVAGTSLGQIYTSAGLQNPYAITISAGAGATSTANFATDITAGAADESAQTVGFSVTNNNSGLFITQPTLASNGTLTFIPNPSFAGMATVTVIAQDNGGTANGGVNTSPAQTFTITTTASAPLVTTTTSRNIATNTATLGGNVTIDGGATITERGVVYSLTSANPNPTIGGTGVTKLTASGTTGVFTTNATGLIANMSYSFKAYAINSAGPGYSSVDTFGTAPPGGTFTSATDVLMTASTYDATAMPLELALDFAPAPGTNLTVIRNTGPAFITGTFTGVANGSTVNLTYDGTTYPFIAWYYGGESGRDLVLLWPYTSLTSWGDGSGQNGDGTFTQRNVPVEVNRGGLLAGKTIVRVARGSNSTFALTTEGKVYSWGNNGSGKLGDGTTTARNVPVAAEATGVLAGKVVVAISAGAGHGMALCSDGTLAAWGSNSSGQLGNNDATLTASLVPVAVNADSGTSALFGKTVTGISAGNSQSMALCSDGTLATWGANSNGRLGDNSNTQRIAPVAVFTGSGSALSGKTVTRIAMGISSLALCSDGTLPLGAPTTTARSATARQRPGWHPCWWIPRLAARLRGRPSLRSRLAPPIAWRSVPMAR